MDTEGKKPLTRTNRVLRAVLGSLPGVGLGALCFFVLGYALGWALFVGALGAFIGAALAQPDVSKGAVFSATASMIVPGIEMETTDPRADKPQPPPKPEGADRPPAPKKPWHK